MQVGSETVKIVAVYDVKAGGVREMQTRMIQPVFSAHLHKHIFDEALARNERQRQQFHSHVSP